MVDDENHKTLSKWSKKDYMREYMRERRKKARQQPAPSPRTDLHGPPAPPNLPRTTRPSKVAILQAHYAHVLSLWAETGKELASLTDTDEMVNTLESLMLENRNLREELDTQRDEVKTLQEALKTCQSEPQEPQESLQPSTQDLQPSEPPQPGLVDPNRRPSPADDTPADWML